MIGLALSYANAYELKGDYPNDGKFVFYDVQRPLSLKCTADESGEIVWFKNETKVDKIEHLKDRYSVSLSNGKKESVFKIPRALQHDSGEYSCRAKGQQQVFRVAGNVFVKVHSNINTVEGETLRVHCAAVGTEVQITWLLPDNSTIDDDGDHDDERYV